MALVTLVSPRYLYWSDWGSRPHIAQGAQDGAPPKLLVTEDMERPQGLALGEGPTPVPKRVPRVLPDPQCPSDPSVPPRPVLPAPVLDRWPPPHCVQRGPGWERPPDAPEGPPAPGAALWPHCLPGETPRPPPACHPRPLLSLSPLTFPVSLRTTQCPLVSPCHPPRTGPSGPTPTRAPWWPHGSRGAPPRPRWWPRSSSAPRPLWFCIRGGSRQVKPPKHPWDPR